MDNNFVPGTQPTYDHTQGYINYLICGTPCQIKLPSIYQDLLKNIHKLKLSINLHKI